MAQKTLGREVSSLLESVDLDRCLVLGQNGIFHTQKAGTGPKGDKVTVAELKNVLKRWNFSHPVSILVRHQIFTADSNINTGDMLAWEPESEELRLLRKRKL